MSHLAYQPPGTEVELEADAVVVGSGAGGASAAVELARAGMRVVLVEAGAWRDPEDYPHSGYGSLRDLMEDWSANVAIGRAGWPIVQARTVGGTTVVNSAICVRTPEDIFARWQRETGVGGDMVDEIGQLQDELEAELSVEEVPAVSMGRSNDLAIAADRALGFGGHPTRRFVKGCAGSGQCLQGCRSLRKQSMNVTFIPEVRERGGTVLSCAPVRRVLIEGGRAVGVVGRFVHPETKRKGASFRVRARHVVLAASVTHTPVLLRRSGIRGAVGAGFRAHPGSAILGLYDDPVDMNIGATQGWASTQFRDEPGLKLETLSLPLDMAASRFPGGGTAFVRRIAQYRHVAMWVHACRAESVGRVYAGPFGRPIVRYGLDRADMERMRRGVHLVAQMHVAAGAREVMPAVYGLPTVLKPGEIDKILDGPLHPGAYTAILSHLFGGATMGADPKRSVCDGHGRVHGVHGLRVADASVIPTNLGVNPQHTIMALARRSARHLAQGAA
jgi:choline dehydrogenase-like flavoprotein